MELLVYQRHEKIEPKLPPCQSGFKIYHAGLLRWQRIENVYPFEIQFFYVLPIG